MKKSEKWFAIFKVDTEILVGNRLKDDPLKMNQIDTWKVVVYVMLSEAARPGWINIKYNKHEFVHGHLIGTIFVHTAPPLHSSPLLPHKSPLRWCAVLNLILDELGYSPWSEWSECSVTCLSGIKTRDRICENKDNISCTGPSRGNETCHAGECPGRFVAAPETQ